MSTMYVCDQPCRPLGQVWREERVWTAQHLLRGYCCGRTRPRGSDPPKS